MRRTKILNLITVVLTILAPTWAKTQTQTEPEAVNFCDVVASAARYDGQTLSIEVVLWPSEHSLSIYGAACVPREGYNVTTQAILPSAWESHPNGRKLRGILKNHRAAKVRIVGVFEGGGGPYGPDAARFRFSIREINSVSKNKTH